MALALLIARVASSSPLFIYVGYKVAWHQVRPAVSEIQNKGQFDGTAFQLRRSDGKTYTITNRHICEDNEQTLGIGGRPLKVIKIAESYDLCALESVPELPSLILADESPEVGATVFSVGFPAGLPLQISPGKIVGTVPGLLFPPVPDWQLSVSGTYGSSGSPVVSPTGVVYGVVAWTNDEGRMGGPTHKQLQDFVQSLP
jgi:S1-C subfamily serine protease